MAVVLVPVAGVLLLFSFSVIFRFDIVIPEGAVYNKSINANVSAR